MTNVFISWSGDLSKEIAEELRKWIPSVLQFAKPYFTPNDIEKGAKWGSEILSKLSETNVGIVCLTPENYQKPWILFEAGALSKDLEKSKLCSILFGMENTDLTGPLTTFQTTNFEKVDFKKLMQSINEAGGDKKLGRETFDDVFEMWWPKLESRISELMHGAQKEKKQELRADRELLEEILSLTRVSARVRSNKVSHLGNGVLTHLCELATDLIMTAELYDDRSILNVATDMHDAIEFIAARTDYKDQIQPKLAKLADRISTVVLDS